MQVRAFERYIPISAVTKYECASGMHTFECVYIFHILFPVWRSNRISIKTSNIEYTRSKEYERQ